jgi:hypothetical protein
MKLIQIIYPLFAMAALSFYITIRLGRVRVRAVLQDGLKPAYFKYNRNAEPPEYMLRTEQHYTNLFEIPVLFYTVCLIAYVTSSVDLLSVLLAWSYVGTRCMHAYIHLRLNKLLKRRRIFIISVFVLVTLWIELFVQLLIK